MKWHWEWNFSFECYDEGVGFVESSSEFTFELFGTAFAPLDPSGAPSSGAPDSGLSGFRLGLGIIGVITVVDSIDIAL